MARWLIAVLAGGILAGAAGAVSATTINVPGDQPGIKAVATGVLLLLKHGAQGNELGASVARAGDINADGTPDLILGAVNFEAVGAALVCNGATGEPLFRKSGFGLGDHFGFAVAGAGDVNGNGTDDIIVGTPFSVPDGVFYGGSVYVFDGGSGDTLLQLHGTMPLEYLGFSVAGVADVNHDGKDDVLIGVALAAANGLVNCGSVLVWDVSAGSLLFKFDGEAEYDVFGGSVTASGDINGDGYSDYLIGAIGADPGGQANAGSAYVYDGATRILLYRIDGSAPGEQLGQSVGIVGDINGDGKDEFIIGAPLADPDGLVDAGTAYVYDGATGSLLHRITGAASGDNLGWSVAGAGDVNGDGSADFVIGAPRADRNGIANVGVAQVHEGTTALVLFEWYGATADEFMGHAVAGAGDLDGDGRDDVLIGAPLADPDGLLNAGSVLALGYCACPCHADPQCDGQPNVFDVVFAVGVAFRNEAPVQGGLCPYVQTDVDCDDDTDVFDVVHLVAVGFRNADPAVEFCEPCGSSSRR